jgi:hypothetical protein
MGARRRPRADVAIKTNNEAMATDGRSGVQAGATENLLYLAKTHLALSNRVAAIDTSRSFVPGSALAFSLPRCCVLIQHGTDSHGPALPGAAEKIRERCCDERRG